MKSRIIALFAVLVFFSFPLFCQEFYWEEPVVVSSGEGRYPRTVSNENKSYAFWQEIIPERKQIYLSVRYKAEDGNWKTYKNFAGPFSYSGEIPELYSAAISSDGTVVVAALSSTAKISTFVSNDNCLTFKRYDFPVEKGDYIAPRVFVSKNDDFLLFCSVAKETTLGTKVAIQTHNFYLYGAVSSDGLNWSDFHQIFSGDKFNNSFSPVIASDLENDYLIFQTQYQAGDLITYHIYSSVSEDGGKKWKEPVLISGENSFEMKETDAMSYDNQLPFAFSYKDKIHVAWERNIPGGDNSKISYVQLNSQGVVPRSAETIADEGNARGVVLFSIDDEMYASWYARGSGADTVYYAKKDGFDWKKESVETGKNSCKNPYPLVNNGSTAFVWQENYASEKNRIKFLAPDTTCAKAAVSFDKYKAGTRSTNSKVKAKIVLPKDSSGTDGYSYSWSQDENVGPAKDENDIVIGNGTLNLSASSEGKWYLKVCVLDKAGNWSEESKISYSLDLTPPEPVVFLPVETDEAGFLNSNSFLVRWHSDDDDVAGYNYTVSKIADLDKRFAKIPKKSLGVKKSELKDYGVKLIAANKKNIEKERRLSGAIKTKFENASFKNLDNGLYVISVAAIDEAGYVGKSASCYVLLNKYVPLTRITKINQEESIFGDVKIDIYGQDFTVDGTITKVVIDADGQEPYDLTVDSQKGGFKVSSNSKISSVNLGNELGEGSYYVGIIHSSRGLCMTKVPALNIEINGTVKIENDYDYQPRWRSVTKSYKYRLYFVQLAFYIILLLSAVGIVVFGYEFVKNCLDYFSTKRIIEQLSKGVLMEAAINENRKRKGTLKASLSGFTISLVAFIIALISIILGTQMIKAQNRTLAKGLHDRVDVLLSSLVTGTRSYLPSGDVLELSQLPRQMNSLSEAQFVTITGLPDMERNAKNSKSLLHIWASNDENIKNKVDVLNARKTSFDPGVSELVKNIENETEVLEQIKLVNEDAGLQCGEIVTQLALLSSESAKATPDRRQEINESMQHLNIQLNNKLNEISQKAASAIPEYNDKELDREITEYLFYRPVLFRSGQSHDFVRGLVFIKVNTSSLIEEVDASTKLIIVSVLIIALFTIAVGIVAAIIFAMKIVKPISRLEKVVKNISEENNKELLLRNEIKNLPNNEIGRLGESVNRMQFDLGVNARELNLQLNASEIQQGLVPLEPLAGNVKQNISKISDSNVNEFAYYKGAAGVSGDYFDFKKLDDRFYVFVKCDASGHAAPAGILVTIIATLYKKWFETWSFAKNGTKLEEFVYKANDFLESLNIKGKFVAMIICLYDSKTGSVYMCHAGDKIYRIYDAETGTLNKKELSETPAVGPFPSFMVEMKGGFKVEKAVLKRKDILLIYTDGIEENGRAKRKSDFSAIMKPKLDSSGKQISDDYGNLEWEVDKEEFGEERVHDIVQAVFNREKYVLTKELNPIVAEKLVFNFTNCEGTIEECVSALASIEKVFRLYKPHSASAKDWVEVDVAIDRFLKDHFNLYGEYAQQPVNEKGEIIKPKNPNYVYYAYCKEDVQEDDLTMIAVQRP